MGVPIVDLAGPVVVAAFTLVGVLVQRGRRETTERFDRLQSQLVELTTAVRTIDARQDRADVERAVLQNEVATIKDRHHLMDMIKRDPGRHRSRRGMWLLAAATALGCVMRWG